jgi:hypothetical protein
MRASYLKGRKTFVHSYRKETTMTEIEAEISTLPEAETPNIERIHTGTCPSLSKRSNLTYAIGKDPEGELHLAIIGNDAAGMFCSDFVPGSAIDAIVTGNTELTSSSFQVLHPHRSTNTAGFILAVLADLGMVRRSTVNTRHHEHVPTMNFASCVQAKFESKPKRKTQSGKEGN